MKAKYTQIVTSIPYFHNRVITISLWDLLLFKLGIKDIIDLITKYGEGKLDETLDN